MPAASEPAPGSVIAMAQVRSPRTAGSSQRARCSPLALQQRLVDVAEGAADQDVAGVAELLLAEDAVHRAQAAAAQRLGHVHRPQAQGLGLLVDGQRRVARQRAAVLDALFERLEFLLDETPHGVEQHLLFVAEAEVHGGRVSRKLGLD
jgi:hypothetical protein